MIQTSKCNTQRHETWTTQGFQQSTSKPIFYFKYSNTIDILNNTIIECSDIAFNETKHFFPYFFLISGYQKKKQRPAVQNGQWDEMIQ
jgi:hypothetical protein